MYIYKDKWQINKIKQGRNSIYHKQRNEIVATKMYIQYMHIHMYIRDCKTKVCLSILKKRRRNKLKHKTTKDIKLAYQNQYNCIILNFRYCRSISRFLSATAKFCNFIA